jgi:hypothetical protein
MEVYKRRLNMIHRNRPRLTICIFLLAISAPLLAFSDAGAVPKTKPPTQDAVIRSYTQKLVAAKTQTVGYVEIAKQHFKSESPQYIQAQKLYIEAQSCDAGWLAKLIEAIRQGDLKDLAGDSDFATDGDTCQNSTKTFVDFVDTNTAPSKGSFSWIGDAIDAAVKLWKAIKSDRQDGRDAVAKRLEANASWPSWGAIGTTDQPSAKGKESKDSKAKPDDNSSAKP